jgi:hypothetical protein
MTDHATASPVAGTPSDSDPGGVAGQLVRRVRDDQRGSGFLAAFIVLFGTLTFGGVGVLVDSARIVSAERHASASAFEAARAGAQAIDATTIRAGNATVEPDAARAAALAAASQLIGSSGASVQKVEVTTEEVIVTITTHIDPWFPVISGRTISETGRARLVPGITEEGQ